MDNLYKILKENREFLEEDKDIFKRPFFISNIDLKSDYEVLGIVKGVALKSFDEITDFTDNFINLPSVKDNIISKAHDEALLMMESAAKALNADGIVGVSLKTVDLMGELVEFFAYGTAVRKR